MDTQAKQTDTECRDLEMDEELVGVLNAISVISKRLAKKLAALGQQEEIREEGGTSDEQNE